MVSMDQCVLLMERGARAEEDSEGAESIVRRRVSMAAVRGGEQTPIDHATCATDTHATYKHPCLGREVA